MDTYGNSHTVTSQLKRYTTSASKVCRLVQHITGHLGVADYAVAVIFVGSSKMRRLNAEFRQKDRSTDVLAFPQQEWSRPLPVYGALRTKKLRLNRPPQSLGDIVISLPDAEANAQRIGQGLDREVCFLLIHGILHLCGHDHMEAKDAARMEKAQAKLLATMSHMRPPMWRQCVRARPS